MCAYFRVVATPFVQFAVFLMIAGAVVAARYEQTATSTTTATYPYQSVSTTHPQRPYSLTNHNIHYNCTNIAILAISTVEFRAILETAVPKDRTL